MKIVKLSKEAQKARDILKDVQKSVVEYRKLFDKIETDEKTLLGAVVIGIYSPMAGVGFNAEIGNSVMCKGLIARTVEKASESGLSGFLALMGKK